MRIRILLALLSVPLAAAAQSYSIDWYKVAGGGGTSAGTNGSNSFTLSGTIGQADAGPTLTGGQYSLTGGFWSMIALVQTAGAPLLSITESNSSVVISWPYPSTGFVLATNSNLAIPANWTHFAGTVSTNATGTSNVVTITPPSGNLYFRLGP